MPDTDDGSDNPSPPDTPADSPERGPADGAAKGASSGAVNSPAKGSSTHTVTNPGEQRSGFLRLVSGALQTFAALAVIVVAVLIFSFLRGGRGEIAQSDDTVEPPLVDVITLREIPVARVWDGYGTARAMDSADVAAQVGARVVERPGDIEAGGSVAKGDLLVALDDTDYRAQKNATEQRIAALESDLAGIAVDEARLDEQLELATAERDIAQRDLDRAREALRRGAGSDSEVDRRLAGVRASDRALASLRQQRDQIPTRRASISATIASTRAELRIAEENLSRTRVTAPIAGTIQDVTPEVGELLAIGSPVARVVDLSRVEVPLRLPVSASRSVRAGSRVTLRTDAGESSVWAGRVTRVAPEADASARTMTVFVEVTQDPAGDGLLLPGQFVVGTVSSPDERPRLVLPRRAVEGDRVLLAIEAGDVIEEGLRRASTVRAASVRLEHALEGAVPAVDPGESQWWVLAPEQAELVRAGARVIVSNLEQLRPGMIVEGRDLGLPGAPSASVPGGAAPAGGSSAAGGTP